MNLREALRVIVITDKTLAAPRSVEAVVEASLRGGARAVQLRDKVASSRDLYTQAVTLRGLTREHGALLFINDRLDVALAAHADGVHLGPHDLPVGTVRRAAPPGFLIGTSTDEPLVAQRLESDGADYIGCGAVFPTTTKRDAGDVIGIPGLSRVVEAVGIPVVGIGGVDVSRAQDIARESQAAGVAVIGAVMKAPDPEETTRSLLAPFAR